MSTPTDNVGPDAGLASERIAGGILPKVLNSFDMVAIFVAIVIFMPEGLVPGSVRLWRWAWSLRRGPRAAAALRTGGGRAG